MLDRIKKRECVVKVLSSKWVKTQKAQKEQNRSIERFVEGEAWRCPTLTWGDPTLPSALLRFTSEFGMESGGATMLLPPSKI